MIGFCSVGTCDIGGAKMLPLFEKISHEKDVWTSSWFQIHPKGPLYSSKKRNWKGSHRIGEWYSQEKPMNGLNFTKKKK